MSAIEVQKLASGRLLSNGRAFIGAYGDNDPASGGLAQVYIDEILTTPYENEDGTQLTQGVYLDLDGFPLYKNGTRVDIYIGDNYSVQLYDSAGGQVWSDARQEIVPESSVGDVTKAGNNAFTGDNSFDISASLSKTWWAGDDTPFSGSPAYSIGVGDQSGVRVVTFKSLESASTNGSSMGLIVQSDNNSGGSAGRFGGDNVAITVFEDGEGSDSINLAAQVMEVSQDPTTAFGIATKQYVDAGRGATTWDGSVQTSSFTASKNTGYTVSVAGATFAVAAPSFGANGDEVILQVTSASVNPLDISNFSVGVTSLAAGESIVLRHFGPIGSPWRIISKDSFTIT